jgi:hypothetical protein
VQTSRVLPEGGLALKIEQHHLRGIVLGCGVLLVGLGAAKGLFGFTLGEQHDGWLSNGLFVVAAVAFLQMIRLRRQAGQGGKKP